MPSQNIGDISPESFKKKDMSSTNVFSIGQSRSRSRNTHNLKKDVISFLTFWQFSIFSKDIQQINDLHASNQDLVLQQKTIKRRFMDNLNMKLRSKTSPRVRGNIDTEGTPRSYSRISDRSHIKSKALTRKLAHAFEMHHDANLNLMLKVQEAYYMQHLVNFIDDEIRSKLKQAKKCNYKNKFKTVFRARQKIERTLERERFEAKKRVAKKTRVVDKLEKFINEFDDEIARRAVELKSKMKENTHNQIQCYLSEMEYLYTNDPQSVLEDTDRQISFIKEDLMKGEDKLKQMKNGSRGNEDLIQKYLRLKKQL